MLKILSEIGNTVIIVGVVVDTYVITKASRKVAIGVAPRSNGGLINIIGATSRSGSSVLSYTGEWAVYTLGLLDPNIPNYVIDPMGIFVSTPTDPDTIIEVPSAVKYIRLQITLTMGTQFPDIPIAVKLEAVNTGKIVYLFTRPPVPGIDSSMGVSRYLLVDTGVIHNTASVGEAFVAYKLSQISDAVEQYNREMALTRINYTILEFR